MNTLADQYYIKALDQYPYSLEEALENLNYALSSNSEHARANQLMAKMYMEQLNDLAMAEKHFQIAMACDTENEGVCLDYILLLITLKEFDKATKLIAYAQKLKGIDLSRIYSSEALIFEYQQKYGKAIANYEKAILESFNEDRINYLNNEIKRVKDKKKLINKTSKDTKSKKKK